MTDWITCIGIKELLLERMEKVCGDIVEKDETFRYKIVQSKFPKYDRVVLIFSPTESQAHRRGVWFVKKAFKDEHLLYWVKKGK